MRIHDKELILVRVNDRQQIKDIITDLNEAKIDWRGKTLAGDIITKNIIIRCITVPIGKNQYYYTRGLKAVGCFGFDEENTKYITRGNNVCKDFTLVKYVKDINDIGY